MKLMLLALALGAQQPQDTVALKPVVVTATRAKVAADMVAAAVTVLRGADLIAQGVRTVGQALEIVPGAHVVETGSFGGQTALFMRGGESDYTKVLLDGVPLNQAGGGIDLAHLTLDNVDRIEVVRGPVSVLYGSDAMTGVVQIFTRSGRGHARLASEVRAGSYGAVEGALDVSGGSNTLAYSARVSRFSADGLYPYNNQYRNSVASAQLRLVPDDRSAVSLTYHYGDDSYHFPTNGTGAPIDSNQGAAERGPQLSLSASRLLGNHIEARVEAAVKEARQLFNDEPDSPGEDGAFRSRDYLRRSRATAVLAWRTRDKISVISGLEYEDERQRGMSDFSASFGDFPDSIRVQRNNTGYFTEAVVAAGSAALTVGGRVDDNSQFGTHGTYRAGVVYRLPAATRLRASVGTGFKEPTFFENFARGFVLGNAGLAPERSQSWEVGIERGAVAVTYFDQRFRDLVEYNPAPPPGEPNYFNVGGAIANGVEAALTANLARTVVFSTRYTFLHTRVTASGSSDPNGLFVPGKPLVRRPAHTLAPQLSATLGQRARVTIGARWVGRRDDVGAQRVTLRPYTRVNLAAECQMGRVTMSGSLENLFNDQTQEINGFRPRGRTVMLGGRFTVGR
ncbi:MAG: TonB-dependent receptor plug domain-containing protein [Gemmatimonadales bacterium]